MVARKNGTINRITGNLTMADQGESPITIVLNATFLSNSFSGMHLLISFQLKRVYAPSVVVNPSTRVPKDFIKAHHQHLANRALNRLFRSQSECFRTEWYKRIGLNSVHRKIKPPESNARVETSDEKSIFLTTFSLGGIKRTTG